jgi:hypothetical protein
VGHSIVIVGKLKTPGTAIQKMEMEPLWLKDILGKKLARPYLKNNLGMVAHTYNPSLLYQSLRFRWLP